MLINLVSYIVCMFNLEDLLDICTMQPLVSSTCSSCIVNSSLGFRWLCCCGLSWPSGHSTTSPYLCPPAQEAAVAQRSELESPSHQHPWAPHGHLHPLQVLQFWVCLLIFYPLAWSLCFPFAPGLFAFFFDPHLISRYPLKGPTYRHFSAH